MGLKNKIKFKNKIYFILVIILLLNASVAYARYPQYKDMPNNWAKIPLEYAIENQLMQGDKYGNIMPYNNLTRAELVTIINRLLGLEKKAKIGRYTDVDPNAWYYDEMAKAVEAGLLNPVAKKLRPESLVTREEAFSIVARAINLEKSRDGKLEYLDRGQISPWALDDIIALDENEYISGYDGRINPRGRITRAEYAQVLYNIFQEFIVSPGNYENLKIGNVVVNSPGVKLKNVKIYGDLILGEGLGDGDIILDNVDIRNRIVIRGGKNIIFKNKSYSREGFIANKYESVRLDLDKGSLIEDLILDGSSNIKGEGEVNLIEARKNSSGSKISTYEALVSVAKDVKIRDKRDVFIPDGETTRINKRPLTEKELAYKRLEALRKKARDMENHELNQIVKLYDRVDLKSDLKLIEKAIADIDKGIENLEIKFEEFKKLEALIKEAQAYKDPMLDRVVNDYLNTSIEDSIGQIRAGIKAISEEMERAKEDYIDNHLYAALDELEDLSYNLDNEIRISRDDIDKKEVIAREYEDYLRDKLDEAEIDSRIDVGIEEVNFIVDEDDIGDKDKKSKDLSFHIYVEYREKDKDPIRLYLEDDKNEARLVKTKFIIVNK